MAPTRARRCARSFCAAGATYLGSVWDDHLFFPFSVAVVGFSIETKENSKLADFLSTVWTKRMVFLEEGLEGPTLCQLSGFLEETASSARLGNRSTGRGPIRKVTSDSPGGLFAGGLWFSMIHSRSWLHEIKGVTANSDYKNFSRLEVLVIVASRRWFPSFSLEKRDMSSPLAQVHSWSPSTKAVDHSDLIWKPFGSSWMIAHL